MTAVVKENNYKFTADFKKKRFNRNTSSGTGRLMLFSTNIKTTNLLLTLSIDHN